MDLNEPAEIEQYLKVSQFCKQLEKQGLYSKYDGVRGSAEGFFEKVSEHLRRIVRIIVAQPESVSGQTSTETVTVNSAELTDIDAAKLLADYQASIKQHWDQQWSDDGAQDKPPYIASQGWRLLLNEEHPEYFRVGRGTRSDMHQADVGDWAPLDRAKLVADQLENSDGTTTTCVG